MIFKEALPLEWMLDPSLNCGPNSAWCSSMAMKLSLTMVCKHWSSVSLRFLRNRNSATHNRSQVMIKFLYRDIVIRRTPQLFALADTIAKKPEPRERLFAASR